MKKVFFIMFFLTSSISLYSIDLNMSFSYQPFCIFTPLIGLEEKKHTITYDIGQYMIYQADLKHRSGFSLGFGLGFNSGYDINDNVIGHISDLFAFLGFKQFQIRVSTWKLPGSITLLHTEQLADGQFAERKFNSKRTTVELLYIDVGFVYGIYYQHLQWAGSDYVVKGYEELYYHTDRIVPTYGIVVGGDSFSMFLNDGYAMFKKLENETSFDLWLETLAYIGFGLGTEKSIDGKYETRAEKIDLNSFLTLGITIGRANNRTRFMAGLGYNIELMAFPEFGLRHGAIGRIGAKF